MTDSANEQQHPNNFPICAASEIGTAGKAGGYVRDGKSDFGKLFGTRSLPYIANDCNKLAET